MKITVIDNYDSFVYNICDYIGRMGRARITVYRNDKVTPGHVFSEDPDGIIISPGPGDPTEAGISMDLIRANSRRIPVLGVCLGHQALAASFGSVIERAGKIFHGKTSIIHHGFSGIFKDMKNPFLATRYHSLVVKRDTMPEELRVSAWTEDDEIMGIEHTEYPFYGVQFHPESILTEDGMRLLANFLDIAEVR